MAWYPRACPECGGDLYDDPYNRGWTTCMSCARSYERKNIGARRPANIDNGNVTVNPLSPTA